MAHADAEPGHGGVRHAFKERFRQVGQLDGTDADARLRRQRTQRIDQIRQPATVLFKVAKVNACQYDFFCAPVDQRGGLVHDVPEIPRPGAPPGEGDVTVTAHRVAAILNFQVDPLPQRRSVRFKSYGERFSFRAGPQNNGGILPGQVQVVGQQHLGIIAQDEVHPAHGGDSLRGGLGVAADNSGYRAGVLAQETMYVLAGFVFSLAGHHAGVYDAQFRRLSERHDLIARRA